MLNELFELQACLASMGIRQQEWHKNYKTLPNNSTFSVFIDSEGQVARLEICSPEKQSIVRKWETSNGHSFPAFNTPPMMDGRTPQAEESKELQAQKKQFQAGSSEAWEFWQALLEEDKSLWKEKSIQDKLTKCLGQIRKDLQSKLPEIPEEFEAFEKLLLRVEKMELDTFQAQMQAKLIEKIRQEPKNSRWFDALFCLAGKPKNIGWILEVDMNEGYPSSHSKVIGWVNAQLLKQSQKTSQSQHSSAQLELDPFGASQEGWQEKLPKIALPAIGNVILRAMTKDAPCQKRYHQIESAGFPVGAETSSKMKTALEWLSQAEHEGKTWRNITRLRNENALLFAYPSAFPPKEASYASFLAGGAEQEDPDGTFFVSCAESVIEALKGIPEESEAEFRVFVLTQPDGFRTKVQFDQGYRVQRVMQAAKDWQAGCKNIPEITQLIFPKKDDAKPKQESKKPISQRPYVPSPGEVIWCCNTSWTESSALGESSPSFLKNSSMKEGLLLLLDEGHRSEQVARFLIRQVLSNALPLLLHIGNCIRKGIVCKTHKNYSKQAFLFPAILGLLLAKLDSLKGDYMQSPFYLIGRLLSLSDQIHYQYAKLVRKGDIPPKLMGNALMQTALEQPSATLANLFWPRFAPYCAWAQTLERHKDARLLKFFLKEIGEVTYQLKQQEPHPTQCNDAEKVQMILGYLAYEPKKTESNEEPETPNEETE